MSSADPGAFPMPGDLVPGAPPPLRGWPAAPPESTKPESTKPESTKPESTKLEPTTLEPTKLEPTTLEPTGAPAGAEPQSLGVPAHRSGGSAVLIGVSLVGVALACGALLVRGIRRRPRASAAP
jgi:hypothetical protein